MRAIFRCMIPRSWGPTGTPGRRLRSGWAAAVVIAGMALAAIAIVLLRRHDPATTSLYPPCLFQALTGLYCPGCGSTRALHALVHGRLGTALGFNPLAVLTLPFLIYWAAGQAALLTGRRLPVLRRHPALVWGLAGGVVVFWVARNLPFHPFAVLAP